MINIVNPSQEAFIQRHRVGSETINQCCQVVTHDGLRPSDAVGANLEFIQLLHLDLR